MTDSTTALKPVTFVRDVEPGPVFAEGSKNKLWKTEDGRYVATSWVAGVVDGQDFAETLAYDSDEEGGPVNPLAYFMSGPGIAMDVQGPEPQYEEALAKYGYKVAE